MRLSQENVVFLVDALLRQLQLETDVGMRTRILAQILALKSSYDLTNSVISQRWLCVLTTHLLH